MIFRENAENVTYDVTFVCYTAVAINEFHEMNEKNRR